MNSIRKFSLFDGSSMIEDVARSVASIMQPYSCLFFPFFSFSNAFSVPTNICNHDGDAQSHKESERMAGRIETRISDNRRSRRVPIQSRNEVNPLYKYTRRKKENRISLLRSETLCPVSLVWIVHVAVYARANTLLPRCLVGYNSIKLWNILKVLGGAHNGGEGTRLLLCQRNTATLWPAPFLLLPFQNKPCRRTFTYRRRF